MTPSIVIENWPTLCRKFPLAAVILVSAQDDIQSLAKSYCPQFDHVFMLIEPSCKMNDFKGFLTKERIINLSIALAPKNPNQRLEESIKSIAQGNLFVVAVKKNTNLDGNIRWLIYDRIKEMKSPLTDVLKLDSSINYCLKDEWITLTFRHEFK